MKKKTQDAFDRGMAMLSIPMNQLPPLALSYAQYLCKMYGGCMEVFITAYAHYAQAVEGLSCRDAAYKIDLMGREWFAKESSPK